MNSEAERVTGNLFQRVWAAVCGWLFFNRSMTPLEYHLSTLVIAAQEELDREREAHAKELLAIEDAHHAALTDLELIQAEEVRKLKAGIEVLEKDLRDVRAELMIRTEQRDATTAGLELMVETLEQYKNFNAMKSVEYRRRAGLDSSKGD